MIAHVKSEEDGMASLCAHTLKKRTIQTQGGTEKMSDDETELQLEKVVKLLAYISDKDLFSEFYRKKLGRRLLMDFSASDELERSILGRLKQQCGAQFTSKVCFPSCLCIPSLPLPGARGGGGGQSHKD